MHKLNYFKLFTSQFSPSRLTDHIDFMAKFVIAMFPKFFQIYCVGVKLKAKAR